MEILKELVKDLAIIGILAGFIEILVPEGKSKYPIRMIFGLYIIAVMLNPFLTLFHKTDLSSLDFNAIEADTALSGNDSLDSEEQEAVLAEAANNLAADLDNKLAALYEGYSFTTNVSLTASGNTTVEITVTGAENSREVALSGEIKAFVAEELGLNQRHISIIFK